MTLADADLPSADEPLDDSDFGVLGEIRDMFAAADPMPAELPERIRFFLAFPGGMAGWSALTEKPTALRWRPSLRRRRMCGSPARTSRM